MTADNILEFNVQVMRAIAAPEQILTSPINQTDPIFEERMEFVCGTIRWLFRNGFVTGTFDESVRFPGVFDAQLSASAYRILNANEPNSQNHQTLGELAISAASQPGTREESVISELVVRRLGG